MPTDTDTTEAPGTTGEARKLDVGMTLVGAGAVLLLISLFLTWYQPGVDAWEIFEAWDLVLAALAIITLTALAGRLGLGKPRPPSWLVAPAVAVSVIVLFAIIDPPPLSGSVDGAPATGLWLALAASVLMTAGALLSTARISVVFTTTPHEGASAPQTGGPPAHPGERDPTSSTEPVEATPSSAAASSTEKPTRRL